MAHGRWSGISSIMMIPTKTKAPTCDQKKAVGCGSLYKPLPVLGPVWAKRSFVNDRRGFLGFWPGKIGWSWGCLPLPVFLWLPTFSRVDQHFGNDLLCDKGCDKENIKSPPGRSLSGPASREGRFRDYSIIIWITHFFLPWSSLSSRFLVLLVSFDSSGAVR